MNIKFENFIFMFELLFYVVKSDLCLEAQIFDQEKEPLMLFSAFVKKLFEKPFNVIKY